MPIGWPLLGSHDTMCRSRATATTSSILKNPTPISQRTTGVLRSTSSNSAWGVSRFIAPLGS
ncbi:MAG: hypothetical protein Q7V57_07570 [Actinomycetota bacterium]|nr:hypothetical protein [Actinomycetota bacterium]